MDKQKLLAQLHLALEQNHQVAINAAQRAHETATADENIAENQYDTLALEAAYLAQGQSRRVEQCAADIQAFRSLNSKGSVDRVSIGSLVQLIDQDDVQKYLFFAPAAGGVKVVVDNIEVVVVTQASPLGEQAYGQQVGDELLLNIAGRNYEYEIVTIS